MKQTITLLSLMMLTLFTYSQEFGIRGGLNYSNFKYGNSSNNQLQKNQLMPTLVGAVYYKTGGVVGIEPELSYVNKGAKTDFKGSTDYQFRTPYLELAVPVFVKAGALTFSAGPYISKLVGTVGNYYFYDEAPLEWQGSDTWKTSSNWVYNTLDWGGKARIDLSLAGPLKVGVYYSEGFRDVVKESYPAMKGWKNRTAGIQLSVPLYKKK